MFGHTLFLIAASAMGQTAEAPASDGKELRAEFAGEAQAYVMTRGKERLTLADQPLLNWSNPARNGEEGAVYAWLLGGRPEVIGSVFQYPSRGTTVRKHALHSLSDQPITAEYDGKEIWSPKAAGVKFAPVPDADAPADSPRLRLSQMRELARQFSLEMIDLRGSKSTLRLMTQPLVRYEPKSGPASDGAIFAFAVGTDPEALLLLEARTANADTRWEFAFARFHFCTLAAQHDGKPVWQVEVDPAMMRAVFGSGDPQRTKVYYSVAKPK